MVSDDDEIIAYKHKRKQVYKQVQNVALVAALNINVNRYIRYNMQVPVCRFNRCTLRFFYMKKVPECQINTTKQRVLLDKQVYSVKITNNKSTSLLSPIYQQYRKIKCFKFK